MHTRLLDAQDKKLEELPAVTVMAAAMLASANIENQQLRKALAHLGCSCTVRIKSIELEDHESFCKFRMKLEDIDAPALAGKQS